LAILKKILKREGKRMGTGAVSERDGIIVVPYHLSNWGERRWQQQLWEPVFEDVSGPDAGVY